MYSTLKILQWIAVIVSGIISLAAALHGAQSVPVSLMQGFWAELVSQGNTLKWLAPVLLALAAALEKAKAMIGPPWLWKAIQQTLDRYHKHIFGADMPMDHYRITLFRH